MKMRLFFTLLLTLSTLFMGGIWSVDSDEEFHDVVTDEEVWPKSNSIEV